MNKIHYILILVFLVLISFYYGGFIKKNVLSVNNFIIENIYEAKDYIANAISKHFNQAKQISLLKKRNEELERTSILATTFANELNRLLEDKNSTQYFPHISLVKTISYVQINDYKKLWLNLFESKSAKIKGLIYNGYTAGIAINKDGRAMALLQGDEKCIFSVYIGKNKSPGLIQGKNGMVVVRYIPKWAEVDINDEILTSGLDNIFFPGIPVGIVSKINNEDMYKSVEVKPYAELNTPSYLYIVDKF
ncbi:rod shape-determining protein MreC [Campylobacter sp. MIT 21-1685]|uniref:rod shape-determining protein MreC n=1 Tax=unclassified Campylobacter TaxID=2593542 RepID=UPI00224B8F79|nr:MULTISPECIES: rod shape-determining protein MreC [unclassified Campylobacter]MCX2682634.1 rod shape-determining protein MreC [Campylobacter sp. MIT 21-1684]MCX2750914.1 rod shape-determining protein MreC [Campylobacter sp. MIT 21-1682]MCX2807153.1 rod shape-determining protein MreC [Campylobacter sp. MIT 21-1685]